MIVQAVRQIATAGSEVQGTEPCEPKVKKARKLGIPVDTTTPLSEVKGPFTHISFINVYSHLPDPVEFLRHLKKIIIPGGHFLLVTGNGADVERHEFPGSLYLPDHLSFAGENLLKAVFDKAGFDIEKTCRYAVTPSLDGPVVCAMKNIARWVTGRAVLPLSFPKGSKFRSLWLYGRAPLCANILETLRPLKLVCRAEEDHP